MPHTVHSEGRQRGCPVNDPVMLVTNDHPPGEATRIKLVGLSPTTIGAMTGVSAGTARGWISGTTTPTGRHAERLADITALIDRLVAVMRADYVKVWLTSPIDALDGRKPVEVIAAGRVQAVSRVVAAIEEAGAA